LTAAQASQEGGPNRSTIAGHVQHLISSLALTARGVRGESPAWDRSHSWTVSGVDAGEIEVVELAELSPLGVYLLHPIKPDHGCVVAERFVEFA